MPKMGFYYNQSACTGCKTCQVACKDKNDNEETASYSVMFAISR